MSLVTIATGFGAPIALAPSWTPFQENSLNDLSSSWPMSVTIPILSELPVPGITPQPATTIPMAAKTARRRFIDAPDLPLIVARRTEAADGATRGILVRCGRSGWQARDHAPDHVDEEDHVEAAPEHEGGERQRVVARSQAQLDPDEQAGKEREHGGDRAEASELPGREEHADRDRDRRLEDHRTGDVAERDDVLSVLRPEQAVRRFRQLRRERREDERDEKGVELHG